MRLTVVGSSGSMSGPRSAASCYLVQASDGDRTWNVLLDLGSGAFGSLMRYLDPALIDAVVLSHLHADHVVDMTGLEVYLRYGPGGALPPVRVLGPAATPERVAALTMDTVESLGESFEFETLDAGSVHQVGPLRIEPREVNHPIEAYGLRITGPSTTGEGDVVLGYSGDTDTCDGLLEVAADADLLLCEAAFQEGRDAVRGIHLTGLRAGQAAHQAGAKHLVLTHLQPWNDAETIRTEARSAFGGPIGLAEPGATWEI
ncbi:MBL fold metallo-hydrolase [Georgenia sp. MJ170]|uniref:MBL fold metallo-hydrolase n=1 Tax=Georgenia sunbinii TaxID=3117728 RepID=UPI002F262EE8